MKLRSYYSPTTDAKLNRVVQIQLQSDAAPAAPFVLLGDINHEEPDNANGMQRYSINHAIYQHVQEQLYRQHGIQDMQRVDITHAGGFVLIERVVVDTGNNHVAVGEETTITVSFVPANATHDPVQFTISNPELVEDVVDAGDGVLKFTNKSKGEVFVEVRTNGYTQRFPFIFDETLNDPVEPEEPTDP